MSMPTVRVANLLLLVSALFVLTVGSFIQFYSLAWGLLATELLLILAPVLWLLYRRRLPLTETLALRWPGIRPVLLAAAMGLGTYALGVILSALGYQLLGYAPASAGGTTTAGTALVMLLATTIAAPLCEEALFRGYLFSAYLQRGARFAIPATALFFAFYHMRFAGLLALLPSAFALSFVRWRSNSLLPAIILHTVHNFMGTGLKQFQALTGHTFTVSIQGLGICVIIGGVALLLFVRTVRRTPGPQPTIRASGFWPQAWPAVAFVAIYITVSAGEVLVSTGRLNRPLRYTVPASWNQTRHWRYEVRNSAERKIGELDCLLEPSGETISLTCKGTESHTGATWRRSDLELLAMSRRTGASEMSIQPDRDGLPVGTLVEGEWPWRLMAHPFTQLGPTAATMASPAGAKHVTLDVVTRSGRMRVLGREFTTTVVRVGDKEEASYDTNGDHLLLRYSNGTVSYVVETVE